ncbi:MAG TPA: TolB family protein [Candidatus Limnocylindria bacterium]|jgi:TolB protein|nr:TolB family protein [Candidatus Limnocylindria bacterium]
MTRSFTEIRKRFLSGLALAALAFSLPLMGQEGQGDVTVTKGVARLIPIALSGFTGETQEVLQFDLYVAGFSLVSPGQGEWDLVSQAGGELEAVLNNVTAKTEAFHRSYPGGSVRSRAHTLADEVVEAVTGRKGIAKYKIAFKLDLGRSSEVAVCDYDGGGMVQLTHDGNTVAAPNWGAGRRSLFYTSYKSGYPDIYSHDLGSGARQPFANFPGLNTSASVSPDGSKVAMILSKSGSPDLWVANADGSGLRQLTTTREDESSPCWSPDGSTICFASRESGIPLLYTIPASGGSMRRLSTGGVGNVSEPDWSPDGKLIAFTHMKKGDNFEICVMPASGGNVDVLAAGEDASWAPNSRTLIFVRKDHYVPHLSLLDVPTKRVKDVVRMTGNCSQPSWSR